MTVQGFLTLEVNKKQQKKFRRAATYVSIGLAIVVVGSLAAAGIGVVISEIMTGLFPELAH